MEHEDSGLDGLEDDSEAEKIQPEGPEAVAECGPWTMQFWHKYYLILIIFI